MVLRKLPDQPGMFGPIAARSRRDTYALADCSLLIAGVGAECPLANCSISVFGQSAGPDLIVWLDKLFCHRGIVWSSRITAAARQ